MRVIGERISNNRLAASRVGAKTILSQSLSRPPVRFVQTHVGDEAALVFVTSFGGGMLEGDTYHFEVDCGPGASLALLPQSNTRIFPCPEQQTSRQSIRGTVSAQSLVVAGGDPVVLYESSRYSQAQHWVLHPEGRLVLLEWISAGRLSRGERFTFDHCSLETKVVDPNGKPLLLDRLKLGMHPAIPEEGWNGFASHFALHVLGPGTSELESELEMWLRQRWNADGILAGLSAREGRGFSLRALGSDRAALDPMVAQIFALLSRPGWLGFDPWKRKY